MFIASIQRWKHFKRIISSLVYSNNGIFDFELFKKITLLDTNPFYDFIKINPRFLNLHKLIKLVSIGVAQEKSKELSDNFIFKTHAANLAFENNIYTSQENCMGVIYLVRDPRSIVPSCAYHLSIGDKEVLKKLLALMKLHLILNTIFVSFKLGYTY